MKNLFLSFCLLACACAGFSQANLQLTMVNPVTHEVTITNFGNVSQTAGSFNLCFFPDYDPLSTLEIISGSTTIAAGASLTVVFPPLKGTNGECGLYANATNFGSAANMRDYFQWGSAGHVRESVAVTAGFWTAGTFVSGDPAYSFIGLGTDQGAAFWNAELEGCTYSNAVNFDSNATIEDGSCTFNAGTCFGDLNADDMVNFADLTAFLGVYGNICP